jgi:methyl-accepting chemotaxis protein
MLGNLKIGTKLLSRFILAAAITAVLGWIAISNIRMLDDRDTAMYEGRTVPLAVC